MNKEKWWWNEEVQAIVYLNVVTMLLMKNVKVIKKEKGQSEWLDLRLRMNYIASWGQRMGKITKTRERKTRDLKCVTIKGQSVLVKE